MQLDPERCRSLLFVPAGNERFLNSALRGDADVIQIDLEDAIATNQKEVARKNAKKDIAKVINNRIKNHGNPFDKIGLDSY